jgi:hypothetical protein
MKRIARACAHKVDEGKRDAHVRKERYEVETKTVTRQG